MLVPAGVSPTIIKRLNDEFNRIISDPETKKRMLDNGYEPVGGTPDKFGAHIHAEIAKWAPVVKAAGVKVD
jgi:tripartite-type tricarboxylate transporter receptor subunit TctC